MEISIPDHRPFSMTPLTYTRVCITYSSHTFTHIHTHITHAHTHSPTLTDIHTVIIYHVHSHT